MDERRQDVMVGLFVLFGLVALGAMILAFGEAPQWISRRGYEIRFTFGKLSDVQEGTAVTMGGIPIGRVSRLEFTNPERPEDGTWAVAVIEPQYRIPRVAVARVRPAAIGFGRSDIAIEFRERLGGFYPTDGKAEIEGEMGSPLDSVFPEKIVATLTLTADRIGVLAKELTPVAKDLHEILQRRPVDEVGTVVDGRALSANLYSAVDRLYRVLSHFDEVLGDPKVKSNVVAAIDNFKAVSEELKVAAADIRSLSARGGEFADKFSGTLDVAREQLSVVGRGLARNSDQLAEVLDNVGKATRDLAEGDGTMGRFLRDPKLYDEMILTVRQINAAVVELRELIQMLQQKGLLGKGGP